jgi:nucleoside-diphosphate-sugar epimerase
MTKKTSSGKSPRILVTGAVGQIGSELTPALRQRYGAENVVATGHHKPPTPELRAAGPFEVIDCTRKETVEAVVDKYNIDTIYHLAAILSGAGEQNPALAWDVNINGMYNILEIARERGLRRIFIPSSIAAFGPETPRDNTPQETVLRPKTMYGVTKVAGELLCDYYFYHFGVDVRGVRYPGIISSETPPSGGTTDYAVHIFYEAIAKGSYNCFLRDDTVLPMMYMPDCIKGTIDLMEADLIRLTHHSDYNLAAFSFSPAELVVEIQKHMPNLACSYNPDFHQQIADSWPRSIDDSVARRDWGWKPAYDLPAMVKDMLDKLGKRHAQGNLFPKA